jgi:hypothetical protein
MGRCALKISMREPEDAGIAVRQSDVQALFNVQHVARFEALAPQAWLTPTGAALQKLSVVPSESRTAENATSV